MITTTKTEMSFIISHRVARMATADMSGKPSVVPICYVYDRTNFYTPIDKKPKTVSPKELKRTRNISENPSVSLVIDEYNEDWDKLCYVIVRGNAELIEEGRDYEMSLTLLTEKYTQYEKMNLFLLNLPVIKIVPQKIISWGAI